MDRGVAAWLSTRADMAPAELHAAAEALMTGSNTGGVGWRSMVLGPHVVALTAHCGKLLAALPGRLPGGYDVVNVIPIEGVVLVLELVARTPGGPVALLAAADGERAVMKALARVEDIAWEAGNSFCMFAVLHLLHLVRELVECTDTRSAIPLPLLAFVADTITKADLPSELPAVGTVVMETIGAVLCVGGAAVCTPFAAQLLRALKEATFTSGGAATLLECLNNVFAGCVAARAAHGCAALEAGLAAADLWPDAVRVQEFFMWMTESVIGDVSQPSTQVARSWVGSHATWAVRCLRRVADALDRHPTSTILPQKINTVTRCLGTNARGMGGLWFAAAAEASVPAAAGRVLYASTCPQAVEQALVEIIAVVAASPRIVRDLPPTATDGVIAVLHRYSAAHPRRTPGDGLAVAVGQLCTRFASVPERAATLTAVSEALEAATSDD